MMWVVRKLKPGDHVRVKRPLYYHHGVYIGDEKVIHYCGENGDSIERPESVFVKETTLDFFSQGGIIEVAKLNLFEFLFSRRKRKRIFIAKKLVGKSGYNFFHNNCETFANECCYTKILSSQIEELKSKIR